MPLWHFSSSHDGVQKLRLTTLLAVAILATSRPDLRAKLHAYRDEMAADVSRASLM